MKNKIKTHNSNFITTSGDLINENTYTSGETYKPSKTDGNWEIVKHTPARYSRSMNKTKAYSSTTKKNNDLLNLNKLLKELR